MGAQGQTSLWRAKSPYWSQIKTHVAGPGPSSGNWHPTGNIACQTLPKGKARNPLHQTRVWLSINMSWPLGFCPHLPQIGTWGVLGRNAGENGFTVVEPLWTWSTKKKKKKGSDISSWSRDSESNPSEMTFSLLVANPGPALRYPPGSAPGDTSSRPAPAIIALQPERQPTVTVFDTRHWRQPKAKTVLPDPSPTVPAGARCCRCDCT